MKKKNLLIGLIVLAVVAVGFIFVKQYKDHMLISRENFTATLLKDNTVLIVGGLHNNKQTDSTEVYNPKTHFSHFVGRLNIPRENHRAILLDDDRVLIAGGTNNDTSYHFITQAEIYDPKTHKFTLTDKLKVDSLYGLSLSKLSDGKILVAGSGGFYTGFNKSNEIYDPKANKFTLIAHSTFTHFGHTANVLPNGNVLIAGGGLYAETKERSFTKTEIYNPKLDKFIQGPYMLFPRLQFRSVTLKDGRVLIIGGEPPRGPKPMDIEIYDPKLNKFILAGKMQKERYFNFEPVLLNDGRVYIVGSDYWGHGMKIPKQQKESSQKESSCEVYDPNTQTSEITNVCVKPLMKGLIPILLPNGKLLLFGGYYSDKVLFNLHRKIEFINTKEIK